MTAVDPGSLDARVARLAQALARRGRGRVLLA